MDSIILYNRNGKSFNTDVIRYFLNDGKKYFIFSLNEVDNNGYLQLYASNIVEDNGKLVMKSITDDNEWNAFKMAIQNIVSNNRNGIKVTGDLDYNELNDMTVTEFKIFKLKKSVADELSQNKNVDKINVSHEESINSNENNKFIEPQTLEAASAQTNGMTIEEILKQVSDGAKNAKEDNVVDLNKKNKNTIDELLNSSGYSNIAKASEPRVVENTSVEHRVSSLEPKVISDSKPFVSPSMNSTVDYKVKYDDLLLSMKKLEEENMKLINELVEAKAKLETIKDIL